MSTGRPATADGSTLPPGQRRIEGFPRFGTHLHHPPPAVPDLPVIEIGGAVAGTVALPLTELARLPRREQTADLHCVAGWSAVGLRWDGVAFRTSYRGVEPILPDGSAPVTHVVFAGLDGHRSIVTLEDALKTTCSSPSTSTADRSTATTARRSVSSARASTASSAPST